MIGGTETRIYCQATTYHKCVLEVSLAMEIVLE